MSNLSIRERNTLAGFEHEDTQALYMRGCQRNEQAAFWMACEWEERLRPFVHLFVPLSAQFHANNPHAVATPEVVSEQVTEFIRERHFRRYFPNQ